jgi:hypothetical protein
VGVVRGVAVATLRIRETSHGQVTDELEVRNQA